MGKKRSQRKPVALTFADTSNQPSDLEAEEGCSSSNAREGDDAQGHGAGHERPPRIPESRDDNEVECIGMVSSSTNASGSGQRNNRLTNREQLRRQQEADENRRQQMEDEDLRIAIELSRREMQGRSFPNSTSEDILGDDSNSDDGGRDLCGNVSLENGTPDREVASNNEAQTSESRVTSREAVDTLKRPDSESDATDISDDNDAAHLEDEGGGHAIDVDNDEDDDDDDDDSSVSSSILLQSDDEAIPAAQEQPGQSSPTQSSERVVAKVSPWLDQEGCSIDIFDVPNDAPSPELFVYDENDDDSSSSHEDQLQQVSSVHQNQEDISSAPTLENRRTRLSLRKRKRELDSDSDSQGQSSSNSTKAPRLNRDPDDQETLNYIGLDDEVDVDVEDDDAESGPSQEPAFIDFPKRFPDNPGVPLVDNREPKQRSPFVSPPGVRPSAYTAVILRLFCQYKLHLLKAQARQRQRLEMSKAIITGPVVKDTIVHKKRGQKIFQWQLSSDEEEHGSVDEEVRDVFQESKPKIKTYLGIKGKFFSKSGESSTSTSTVAGSERSEPPTLVMNPTVATGKATVVSNKGKGVKERESSDARSAEEVTSSRTLVRKVLPLRVKAESPRAGEWVSKADMSGTREAKRKISSSDGSDTDVEVVPEVTSVRTPLTAAISPRRSTPIENQVSNSGRSPVFSGRSSRGPLRQVTGQVRIVGHCSPRTVHNRNERESPQPSSPGPGAPSEARTEAVVVESASGVSSTVPDNEARAAGSRIQSSQEPSTSGNALPVRTSTDSVATDVRPCSSSTNNAEPQDSSKDANIARSRMVGRIPDPAFSYEELRMVFYERRARGTKHSTGNGFADVDSSNVNGNAEVNGVQSDDENISPVIQPGQSRESNREAKSSEREDLHDATPESDNDVQNRRRNEEEEDRSSPAREHGDEEIAVQNEVSQADAAGPSTSSSGGETDHENRDNDRRNEEPQVTGNERVEEGRREGQREEGRMEDRREEGRREERREEGRREERREEGVEQGAVSAPVAEPGVQCPLCGVTFAINVIEVHASGCNGLVENADTPPREQNQRDEPDPAPVRPPNPQGGAKRTSEGEEDEESEVSLVETRTPVKKQPIRKRNFPSSEGTSDSPTSSVGSMSHFDHTVMNMVRRKEINITQGPSTSSRPSSNRGQPASKKKRLLSKVQTNDIENIEDDDDEEEEETEKCFICNKYIPKSIYQQHVQNELDRMEVENSFVESTSSNGNIEPRVTRHSGNSGNSGKGSGVSSNSASTSSRLDQRSAGSRGENSVRGTRGKRVNGTREVTSTLDLGRGREAEEVQSSSDEYSGPNSPSALDQFLDGSDSDDENDEDDDDESEDVFRDISAMPVSDSPIKAFKSLKQNPYCLIDFKNQFKNADGGKTPKRTGGKWQQGRGRGRGRGKSKKKWRRGGKSRK